MPPTGPRMAGRKVSKQQSPTNKQQQAGEQQRAKAEGQNARKTARPQGLRGNPRADRRNRGTGKTHNDPPGAARPQVRAAKERTRGRPVQAKEATARGQQTSLEGMKHPHRDIPNQEEKPAGGSSRTADQRSLGGTGPDCQESQRLEGRRNIHKSTRTSPCNRTTKAQRATIHTC